MVRIETLSIHHPPSTIPFAAADSSILGPVEKLSAEFWPGVPVLPLLEPVGTDGTLLNAAGIPT